jgi:hypothetical protein
MIATLLLPALLTAAGAAPVGVVGFEGGRPGAVARLSPRTLEPASRPVALRGYAWGSALAPHADSIAVGVAGGSRVRLAGARLQLVDLRRGRTRALVRLTRRDGAATVVAWPTRRRILALVGARADGRASLALIDPAARRVLRRTRLAGEVVEAVARPAGLVALVAPRRAIGPATLVAIGPSGRPRTIAMPGLAAGARPGGEFRHPGLAVDPAGREAWVLASDGSAVAAVDLVSGAVAVHPLAASAKDERGSWRSAAWLPSGLLAVTGYEAGEGRISSIGLRLLDPRAWTLRAVDATAEQVSIGPGGLLAAQGGLRVYDVFGRPRLQLPTFRHIVRMSVGARYAYVSVDRPAHRTSVIDLRTGATVARLPTAQPPILLG